jgi:hypothetical protein
MAKTEAPELGLKFMVLRSSSNLYHAIHIIRWSDDTGCRVLTVEDDGAPAYEYHPIPEFSQTASHDLKHFD